MLRHLVRQLLPGSCLLCDGPLAPDRDLDLCRHCYAALPWNPGACPRCALPAAPGGAPFGPQPCPSCRLRPPPFARSVAPLRYEDCARHWIGRLKDHLGMVEGRLLGLLLAEAAAAAYADGDLPRPALLIPVPLTWTRLARRGHNQALTLALPVARRLGVPVLRRAALRTRPGPAQRGAARAARLRNPVGRFACRRSWDAAPCIGIVDDVMTTGATVAELARVLLGAGAGEVHVLSAARTPAPPTGDPQPAAGRTWPAAAK